MPNTRSIYLGTWNVGPPGDPKVVRATIEIDLDRAGVMIRRAADNKSGKAVLGHGLVKMKLEDENTPG